MSNGIRGLLDCTLREGSYKTAFSLRDCARIAHALGAAGVRFVEVDVERGGGSRAPHSTSEYLRTVSTAAPAVTPGIFAMAATASLDAIGSAVAAGARFVRIGAETTELVETALPLVTAVKALGVTVAVNAMKSHTLPAEEIVAAAAELTDAGADLFYLVDSAGCMVPDTVRTLTQALVDRGITVGFHGHDNLTLAVANSLAALAGGALAVDGTLRGAGRSAGNAQLEVLAVAANKLGLLPGLDTDLLARAAEQILTPLLPTDRGVTRLDLLLGATGCHSDWIEHAHQITDRDGTRLPALLAHLARHPAEKPSLATAERLAKAAPHATPTPPASTGLPPPAP
ncbi:hypothetical protein ACFV07_19510 [Streptomyces anulatus]|uniref:hypothetical protein n=1 Tax=Streptomyces anulatus TaxID=1892 RepID=UPI00369D2004